ncbi:MAG: metal-dependent phosphohydrolase [Ignavibacteria bacterium]|nr:metal-dependent phosphohydrolase [Ignavibacteria bacterium]
MQIIDSIISANEFATLPTVPSKLLEMLNTDEIYLKDISNIIEMDPSLTLKLLRVANSSLYATSGRISSIQQAIMIMGFSKLTNIVLGVSIFSKFWLSSQPSAYPMMEKFWLHSSSTGTIARSVSAKIGAHYKEHEFIGGLLHQIGKLALMQYDFGKFSKVIEEIETNKLTDEEAEKKIFGVSHLEVGERIATLWRLPEELITIIANYPHPSKLTEHRELVAAVSFAGVLSEINGADFYKGLQNEIVLTEQESWLVLCQSFAELQDMGVELFTSDVENELKKASQFLAAIK